MLVLGRNSEGPTVNLGRLRLPLINNAVDLITVLKKRFQ